VTPETATSRPDISQINDYLYLSAWPEGEHADEIQELGVRLILSMHWGRPSRSLGKPPLQLLWLPTIDSPITPMPIASLQQGVETAIPVIQEGYRVLAHCRYGIHRSAAMACCLLIGMGFTSEQAMQLVKEKRPIADPYIWYIRRRIEKFERHWKRVHS
jgi:dual specificity MAP kinase phosphatase